MNTKTAIDCTNKALIIGAGAAGLAAMNSLKKENISFDAVESYQEIGGLWNYEKSDSPVSQNTHAIGHKTMQIFENFLMPKDYPAYPNKKQILDYLISFAQTNELYNYIQFNTSVVKIEKAGQFWNVTLNNGETRCYSWILIASGYHSQPNIPQFKGEFTGEMLHSKEYKKPEQLKNKNVLVVGCGQSAMDILEDSSTMAQKSFHSTRRGFYIGSKFILGFPAEQVANFPIIKYIPTQIIFQILSFISPAFLSLQGINLKKLNIPSSCYSHGLINPVFNQTIYQYYMQGDIIHKPNIKELKGSQVLFEDGTEEEVDTIVYATGFKVKFPFIDKKLLNWHDKESHPSLYLHCIHPHYDNLFVIGMIHPIGTHWRVFEAQSNLISAYINAQKNKLSLAKKIEREKSKFQANLNKEIDKNQSLIVDKRCYIKQTQSLIQHSAF